MNGLRWLMTRAAVLLAALVAVCAFHGAASEPAGAGAVAGQSAAVQLVGPLHVDLSEVPSTASEVEQHAHLLFVVLVGASMALGLVLAAKALRLVAYVLARQRPSPLITAGPAWSGGPSLAELRVVRR
ncbi:hypothetical protein PWY87_31830 [Kribbella solani]|uniref:hypothetical protein n=1 Tax=Kribbella solani TaxID=236067 RepID=UPI0029BECD14|nr:hypothetical protein [Kribbella solani]MDX3006310.1 hypothetical protein [Kribbella solani]